MTKQQKRRRLKTIKTLVTIAIVLVVLGFLGIATAVYDVFINKESVVPTTTEETVSEDTADSNTSNNEYIIEGYIPDEVLEENNTESLSADNSSDSANQETSNQEQSPTSIPQENEVNIEDAENEPVYTGTIYLTFDDGPSPRTPEILDILAANNIKATFFVIGYEEGSEREEFLKRAFNEGHTIGLHGNSHDYSSIYTSLDSLIYNYSTLQDKVYNSIGVRSYIIRFPGGSSNTVSKKYCTGIMSDAASYFVDNGYIYFDWNVDSNDAGGANTSDAVYQNVISTLIPGKDNVILMHDAENKTATVGALQNIIDYGLENGYKFEAITMDTPMVTHHVNN